jgi:hypothetical protein
MRACRSFVPLKSCHYGTAEANCAAPRLLEKDFCGQSMLEAKRLRMALR